MVVRFISVSVAELGYPTVHNIQYREMYTVYIDYTAVPWDHRIVKRLMSAVIQLTQHFIAVTQHLKKDRENSHCIVNTMISLSQKGYHFLASVG
jgi:hypothetical protein